MGAATVAPAERTWDEAAPMVDCSRDCCWRWGRTVDEGVGDSARCRAAVRVLPGPSAASPLASPGLFGGPVWFWSISSRGSSDGGGGGGSLRDWSGPGTRVQDAPQRATGIAAVQGSIRNER